MKRTTLLKSVLLLCALVAGSGSVWADTYIKASSISVGDVVVLVVEGVGSETGMELTSISSTSTKYGIGTSFDTTPAGTYAFEVVAGNSEGSFAFKNGTKYLYWTSGNSLNVDATLNDKTSWTVSISSGNATICNKATPARQIWWNVSSPRFACYTDKTDGDSYKIVQLYKKVVPVSIPASGYASLVSSEKLDFSSAITNVTAAYKATAATSGSSVTLTSLSGIVAATTPMIIKGTPSSIANIPVTTSSATADVTGNLLSGSATAAQAIAANAAYILKDGKFCLVTAASSVPKGKAYLLASNVDGGANELTFVIDEENSGTTGINKATVNKPTDGQYYNLAGQRVANPTKGLYIVNGKKVIIK